ncbi:gamma-glutamyltransferase [Cognatishimia activa]|uniref:Glutathione hydrolase proenzyme n=1 Tax=Cognatishimia activa TaxID=1715691 RepID=A0A0P1IL75_9RHOB|nr:gamma-glutamyltransferase [Cognatishimia activa]CUI56135.1 Putative gamma-glutamyltransferase YwrD [Cognatishimia activa]CUK24385.1 Putative gamma-glutamyltransferase YwrD [Cognatishimia activa]
MRDFHKPGRSAVFATNGMCATSHPLAAQTAIDVLKRGGNAMDAAIAGAVLLGICEPQMTSIGGDCFALVSPAGTNKVLAMNGSGHAPRAAKAEDLREQGLSDVPITGPESVTIPTAVDAFCKMSERWGKLGIDALLAPAIHYAEEGVPVAPRVAADWVSGAENLKGSARRFYLKDGQPLKTGDIFRSPEQAEVLRRIAKSGASAFYEGEVAEDMQATLAQFGGVHQLEDFADANAFETDPIQSAYKDVDLIEHPPNGQGATAGLILNILSNFDLASMDPFGVERTHIEAEAVKLGYDARNRFLADPDHMAKLEYMLSNDTASQLADLIDPKKAMANATQLSEAVHKDTIYITVVDKDRMSVSLIYSIFHTFGAGIASDKFGILLHNRGSGFTLKQGHPNEYGAGKRPMHTIIPGMLAKSNVPVMPFGVMGGQYQANGHARLITNLMDFGMDIQTAIDSPRAFAYEGQLQLENTFPESTARQLADMGHEIVAPPSAIGGAQAIFMHDTGILEGGSDPRKDGCALGY